MFIMCLAVVPLGAAANAAGSDAPTPYTVTKDGIQLPAGDTFRDNGHINIKVTGGSTKRDLHFEGKCITRTDAECAGDRHADAQYIGKSFIPWSAFGLKGSFCVTWVQISHYNEHFGEGGQSPVCVGDDMLPEDDSDSKKVKFCHATGSESNPFVLIETSVNAFYQAGHDTHQDGRDIVPPFSYKKKGQTISFPGLNWDATGQAIFSNGCVVPKPEEPPVKIDLPTPTFEDPCGPNNASWDVPKNTDVLTWSVDDQGNLIATIIKDKTVFENGTTSHNYGKAPESGEACPPEVVISPSALVEVLCDGTGTATLDNSKSTTQVGFEVVVNGVATLYSVAAGTVETKAFSGAQPGSQVIVQDGEAIKLSSATVPNKCDTPVPPKPEPVVTETSSTSQECGDDFRTINRTVTTTDWVFDEKTWTWIEGAPMTESFTETVVVDVVPCVTPPEKPTPPVSDTSKVTPLVRDGVLPSTGGPELTLGLLGALLVIAGGGLLAVRRRVN